MAFNPSSTIYLCNVPIDNTYQNQIYFSSKTEQQNYFSNRVQKTFTDYLTVRKTLPDGSLVSSVKVNCNIDDLYNCNYMYYQNANHGTKFFYAFITNLIYINEGTTEIRFETDVYQTWCFDVELKQSYVVREHSVTDEKGENIVPEKFTFQDYEYYHVPDVFTDIGTWKYLIASSENIGETTKSRGILHSGVYQGMYFYCVSTPTEVNNLLNAIEEKAEDSILFISLIPAFNTSNATIDSVGFVGESASPASKTYTWTRDMIQAFYDSQGGLFHPKNNKLWTSPFYKLLVTNHSGEQAEYSFEDFEEPTNAQFKMYGDISANPSLTLIPLKYKGVDEHFDSGISITGFPQCAFNSDTFKLWLAKNQYSLAMGAVTGIGEVIGGIGMMATGAGAGVGGAMIAHGATSVLNTMNSVHQAQREPNKTSQGAPKNNLLTALNKNKFDFYVQFIKVEHAKTIDNFFTMYGYATNKLKVPNVSSRPYFNYVQTVDCNITGGIPDNDMKQLKSMYNNGVTLWKPSATVGDYSVDNSPK